MSVDLSDPAQRERFEGRERRAYATVARQVRERADRMPPDAIAAELGLTIQHVRDILARNPRKLRTDRAKPLPEVPNLITIGQVRKLVDPPVCYRTARKILGEAVKCGVPVFALPGKIVAVPKPAFLRWLATRAVTDAAEIDYRARDRKLRESAAHARAAKADRADAARASKLPKIDPAVIEALAPAPAPPRAPSIAPSSPPAPRRPAPLDSLGTRRGFRDL